MLSYTVKCMALCKEFFLMAIPNQVQLISAVLLIIGFDSRMSP